MRHLKRGRKFGRTRKQRRALLRNLAYQLIMKGRIVTTEAKAKELRPMVEKVITRAKTPTLKNRRLLASKLPVPAVKRALEAVAPSFAGRSGGYTRIIKLGPRKSDASKMAIIEFVK